MLPFKYRIKKKKEFDDVFRSGKRIENHFYLIKIKKNGLAFSRFAFVVPLRLSKKATKRNKIKRRLREAVRSVFYQIEKGFDIIFISKERVKESEYREIKEGIIDVLKKAEIIRSQ